MVSMHLSSFAMPVVAQITAIFMLIVSSAVLLHDVLVHTSDVSIGIAVFPIG